MTTTSERITYEVLWGIEERERGTWVDYGDGMAYSRDAETNATRAFLDLVRAGRKAEFCVNGAHRDGYDFAEEWAAFDRWCAEQEAQDAAELAALVVVHKTVTHAIGHYEMNWRYARMQRSGDSIAKCSCGWKRHADTRAVARLLARHHREEEAAKLDTADS